MTPDRFYRWIVRPGLSLLAEVTNGLVPRTAEAEVMLTVIPGQESHWTDRLQLGGPARSMYQFEAGGAVAEVLAHLSTRRVLAAMAAELGLPANVASDRAALYEFVAWNDHLAVTTARLRFLVDPGALPTIGDERAAYRKYVQLWAPGHERPETWSVRYQAALQAIRQANA